MMMYLFFSRFDRYKSLLKIVTLSSCRAFYINLAVLYHIHFLSWVSIHNEDNIIELECVTLDGQRSISREIAYIIESYKSSSQINRLVERY